MIGKHFLSPKVITYIFLHFPKLYIELNGSSSEPMSDAGFPVFLTQRFHIFLIFKSNMYYVDSTGTYTNKH